MTHSFPRSGGGNDFTHVGVDILASTRSDAGLLARWGASARRKGLSWLKNPFYFHFPTF